MHYSVLATDFDGTLASQGRVGETTCVRLQQWRKAGHKLVLITGRELGDLEEVFPQLEVFDLAIVENGAVLYTPATRETRCLAAPPPEAFVTDLRQSGIPLATGRVIVATWRPYERTVVETIQVHGLALQVIFNKDAIMVLPAGVNKASGLRAGLLQLGLSPHQCVGVGDAENDLAFLAECGHAVAVANALEPVRNMADWVTPSASGAGVCELIDALQADTDGAIFGKPPRHERRPDNSG